MAIDATPEGVLPLEPAESEAVTVTLKLVEVVCDGSASTELVGGVVSISQEIDCEPVPGLPEGLRRSAASMDRS